MSAIRKVDSPVLILVVLLSNVNFNEAKRLPEFVKPCERSLPNLEGCMKDAITELKPRLISGIPEMGVPPLDPLSVPEMYLDGGSDTNFAFKFNLTDLEFFGIRNLQVMAANINLESHVFSLKFFLPSLNITGRYDADGKILLIQFKGEGHMSLNFSDVTITTSWNGIKAKKQGKEHYRFEKEKVAVEAGDVRIQLDDLFKNNEELTTRANEVFNENNKAIFEDLKPVISETISELLKTIINNVHDRYPVDVLYPKG